MSVATERQNTRNLPDHVLGARTGFLVLAWIFLAGIGVQVFLAGMGLFVDANWWAQHKSFVHLLEAVPILMLLLAFVGRLPSSLKWLTAATFALIGVQYATIEIGLPTLAAFHPVNAILLVWLTLTLVRRVPRLHAGEPDATSPF